MTGILCVLSEASWLTYAMTVLTILVMCAYLSRRPWLNLPPGPPYVPILGSMPFMGKTDTREAYRTMRIKYGDIFTVRFGPETFIVINGYEALKDVLVDKGQLFAGKPHAYFMQGMARNSGNYTNFHRNYFTIFSVWIVNKNPKLLYFQTCVRYVRLSYCS